MMETQGLDEAAASVRTRIFTWADPAGIAAGAGMTGLELLTAMSQGRLPSPPVASMLGFRTFEVEPEVVTVTIDPQEFHYNPLGTVHGGVIATLLDTVAGCAVHTTLPAGVGYASLDLATKFLRPVKARSGTITARGTVVHRGSRTALAEARLTDSTGTLLATATSSCVILG